MTEAEVTEIGDKIVKVLKTIYDPEIPVDIYELGLIYDVFVNEENNAIQRVCCYMIYIISIHFKNVY